MMMVRVLLILAATSIFLVKINAQDEAVCKVGESQDENGGSHCNGGDLNAGNAKCADFCKKAYGAELLNSTCSQERPNNQRECICSLKCANGGCWGDPHCHSFDNTQFGFQALRKYYVFKPLKPFPTLPEFEIHQSNRPWGNSPMSVLHHVTFIVMDWGQVVQIQAPELAGQTYIVQMNRKVINVPHRYSRYIQHREEFIDISWGDAAKLNLIVKTSFGVIIAVSNHVVPGNVGATSIYTDLSVDIPRHPELKGTTAGLLGRWNDDPKDDNIDANGKPQELDDEFSHNFGNSWLVPGGGIPSECELEMARKKHAEHAKKFSKENRDRLTKMCKENLDLKPVHQCLKCMDRPPIHIHNCVLDLSHIADETGQHNFLRAMVEKIDSLCPSIKIKFKKI